MYSSDMELTKETHATIVLSKDGNTIVIDPGAYTPNSAELVAGATGVLITHDHPDHFDAGILNAALSAQPGLRIWAPQSVVSAIDGDNERVIAVAAGDTLVVDGFDVTVFGVHHAPIHRDLPDMQNVAYLIDNSVYHPGDSYVVPDADVQTLLVPSSGPWTKLEEAVDFVRAVKPSRVIQIHDLMLSDPGRQSFAQFVGDLTGTTVETVETGTTITL
jgi:L-ascorbate metabolism protein UlaG (beta-lactamase superfamily)